MKAEERELEKNGRGTVERPHVGKLEKEVGSTIKRGGCWREKGTPVSKILGDDTGAELIIHGND